MGQVRFKKLLAAVLGGCVLISAQAADFASTKLTHVGTTPDLGSSIENGGAEQVFGGAAYGTFMAVDDGSAQASWPLFGPADVPAGGGATSATGYTPWTAGTQTVSGTGTATDPFKIVTTGVLAGSTGLSVTQTDSLIDPDEFLRTDVTVTNTSGTDKTIILYQAMDCYLGANDAGFGMITSNTVGCIRRDDTSTTPPTENDTDPSLPISRVELFLDLTGGAKMQVSEFGAIWSTIGKRQEFSDACLPTCNTYQDNGMGLSWKITIPAGASRTISNYTLFSPTGDFPIMVEAEATPATGVKPGDTVTYTITLSNANMIDVDMQSVSFALPPGFTYVPGSSVANGVAQPTVTGNIVTWTGGTVPADGGSFTYTFQATVGTNASAGVHNGTVSAAAGGGFAVTTPPPASAAPVAVAPRALGASTPVPANNPLALLLGTGALCAFAATRSRKQRKHHA